MSQSATRHELTINVAALLAEPAGSDRDYAFADLPLELGPDSSLALPVQARFRLTRTSRGLLVIGDVHTALAESCSRCLRQVLIDLDAEIREEALPSIDLLTGAVIDPAGDPEVARLTGHHEIMLEPFIREAIVLASPIAPLCRADCPGLCQDCGVELASGPHGHPDEPIDPRLEALRGFQVDGDADSR